MILKNHPLFKECCEALNIDFLPKEDDVITLGLIDPIPKNTHEVF
jgi:hypothetical protein